MSAPEGEVDGGGGGVGVGVGVGVDNGFTAIMARAYFVLSAALVACTTTLAVAVTLGEVNTPVLEIVPLLDDQLTAVLVVLLTDAVNCCVPPDLTLALPGFIVTLTAGVEETAGLIETVALALLVVSAVLVAFTVAVVIVLTLGAVYQPSLETDPVVADQLTEVLLVPLTNAASRSVPADWIVEAVGDTATVMLEPEELEMLISARVLATIPFESTARSLNELVVGEIGVPVTAPVVEFKTNPLGREPSKTAKR